MKKVLVYYEGNEVRAITLIEESDISDQTFVGLDFSYLILDEAPIFSKPIPALRVNTQTNPPSVYCDQAAFESYMLPLYRKNAIAWKKMQLSAVDWSQVQLSVVDRKIIMGANLTDPEKDALVVEWKAAGSPEV